MTSSHAIWRRLLSDFRPSRLGDLRRRVPARGRATPTAPRARARSRSGAASLTESGRAQRRRVSSRPATRCSWRTARPVTGSTPRAAPGRRTSLGVGAATVDLWVSSGWMPLAEPTAEPERKPPKFTRPQILEIVKYVTSLAPSATIPAIPFNLDISHANVAEGFSLFALNCAPCHTITGAGDALAERDPGAAAARRHQDRWSGRRSGPDRATCPASGPGTISPSQVVDIVGYVVKDIEHPAQPRWARSRRRRPGGGGLHRPVRRGRCLPPRRLLGRRPHREGRRRTTTRRRRACRRRS